jgi:hypothetical protein
MVADHSILGRFGHKEEDDAALSCSSRRQHRRT